MMCVRVHAQCLMRVTISQTLKWIISYRSLKLLKNCLEIFYVNAKQEVYLKIKKLFIAKTTIFRKA